jgi:hypothetical protein
MHNLTKAKKKRLKKKIGNKRKVEVHTLGGKYGWIRVSKT